MIEHPRSGSTDGPDANPNPKTLRQDVILAELHQLVHDTTDRDIGIKEAQRCNQCLKAILAEARKALPEKLESPVDDPGMPAEVVYYYRGWNAYEAKAREVFK